MIQNQEHEPWCQVESSGKDGPSIALGRGRANFRSFHYFEHWEKHVSKLLHVIMGFTFFHKLVGTGHFALCFLVNRIIQYPKNDFRSMFPV